MIEGRLVLPLIASFVGLFLAMFAAWNDAYPKRTRVLFSALCGISSVWAFGQFLILGTPGSSDSLLSSPGSPTHWIGAITLLAAAAAPTYWLIFAASFSGHTAWVSGWRLPLVHLLPIYTVAVGATNPWHGLFLTEGTSGTTSYGPLSIPYLIVMYVFIGIGAWMIWRGARSDHGTVAVRVAILIVLAVLTPILGGLIWNLRNVLGLSITINPVPSLFVVFDAVIAFGIFRSSMSSLPARTARIAVNASDDAVIIADDTLAIRALNEAALKIYPQMKLGADLQDLAPEISRHAAFCIEYGSDDLSFEFESAGRVYWGRVRRSRHKDDPADGCAILLTDLTGLRCAQTELLRAGRTADGDLANTRYRERLRN